MTNIPRPEYPRPQMTRDSWINLNGKWEFEFDFGKSGKDRNLFEKSAFSGEIIVPFCPESRLSGIGYTDFIPALWYRRTVCLNPEQIKGRTFIRFGAADYHCEVWVNGIWCGKHDGGYSSFAFELTGKVKEGENSIVVYAEDENRSGNQPCGKQSDRYFSHTCHYTRTTGIWQTVWLEFTPKTYIKKYKVVPQYMNSDAIITVYADGCEDGCEARVAASFDGVPAGETGAIISGGSAVMRLGLNQTHLWAPGSPNLYDLTIELIRDGVVVDRVNGYFGLRGIEIRDGAICLNGKPVFQRLVLDQGFNPEGIYTAPDDEFLKHDIELSMSLGFNGARLHERVFEERFFYWADRLGYIVWGEHADWGLDLETPCAIDRFLPEWAEIVERDYNHPSIVGWSPLNERYEVAQNARAVISSVFRATKYMDPTRPVIDTNGGHHVLDADVFDMHNYTQNPEKFAALFEPMKTGGPVYVMSPTNNVPYAGQPYFVSEYGGTWWNPDMAEASGTDRKVAWGYGSRPRSEEDVIRRYEGLTKALIDNPKICGLCYTQLTDVEQEQNGLFRYDRGPKFSAEGYARIKAVNTSAAAIEKQK